MVCGIEHHMNKQFTDALCVMLKCPAKSPRGRDIPMGECCKTSEAKKSKEIYYRFDEIMAFLWM